MDEICAMRGQLCDFFWWIEVCHLGKIVKGKSHQGSGFMFNNGMSLKEKMTILYKGREGRVIS